MGRQVNVAMIQTFCDLYQKTRKKPIKIIIGAQVHYKKYQKKSVRKHCYLLIRVTDRSFFSIRACKLFCPTYSITIMPWFCSLSYSVSSITCLIFVTFSWFNFKAFNSFVREVLCFMIFTATRSPKSTKRVQFKPAQDFRSLYYIIFVTLTCFIWQTKWLSIVIWRENLCASANFHLLDFFFRKQPAEFLFSEKFRQMKSGLNNKYEITNGWGVMLFRFE